MCFNIEIQILNQIQEYEIIKLYLFYKNQLKITV